MPTTIKLKNNVTSGDDFSTVTPGNLANGEVIVDTVNGKLGFKNQAGNALHEVSASGGGATALGDLTDVDTAAATNTQVLTYNNGVWEPGENDASGTVDTGDAGALAFYQSNGNLVRGTSPSEVKLHNGEELIFGGSGNPGVGFTDGGDFSSFIRGQSGNILHFTLKDSTSGTPSQTYFDFDDVTSSSAEPCIRIAPGPDAVGSLANPALQIGSGYLKAYTGDKVGHIVCDKVDGSLVFSAGNNLDSPNDDIINYLVLGGNQVTLNQNVTINDNLEVLGGTITCKQSNWPSIVIESGSPEIPHGGDTHIEFREQANVDGTTKLGMHITYDGGDNNLKFYGIDTNGTVERMRLSRATSGLTVTGSITSNAGVCSGSSREYKEEIQEIDEAAAYSAVMALEPVTYVYKQSKEQQHLGFIAEDVPELVAMNDRKSLAALDITAALTKVIQKQDKEINELKKDIEDLKNLILNSGVN